MSQQLFKVGSGAALVNEETMKETEILHGSVDPSVSPGIAAPTGSVYYKDATVGDADIFQKFGDLDTQWRSQQAINGAVGVIGTAEDVAYDDGLFTDFTPTTPVGTAVDRFNEILKALSPGQAPALSAISHNQSGAAGKLSFGSTHAISGYTPVDVSAGGSAVDINGSYTSSGSRKGLFNRTTAMTGTLASGVSAKGINYPANSFGFADQGTLQLIINGLVAHTVDLASFVSGTSNNANGSGFTLSAATAVQFPDTTPLDLFKYRTGTYNISVTDQRDGMNYIRVNHNYGGVDHYTGYFEWVNDDASTTISATGGVLDNLSLTGSKYLSGVQYNTGGTAQYDVTLQNLVRNVYSSSGSAISFVGTNGSAAAQAIPNISSESDNVVISNAAVTITSGTRILNAALTIGVTAIHPLRTGVTNAQSQSIAGLLIDGVNTANSVLVEQFCLEDYRLESVANGTANAYASQSDITAGANSWTSSNTIGSGAVAGYADALLVYNGAARYPTQGLNSGDFRKTSEGGSILNAPAGNPNYTGLTGTKYYYRRFQNNTGLTKANFTITIAGTGSFASVVSGPSGQNLTAELKFGAGSISTATGWMDMYADFATNQWADGNGARNATSGAGRAMGTAWGLTVGTKSIANGEWIVVRIAAPSTWTGSISNIALAWA